MLDVLHSNVDAFGYDVALGLEEVTRHIQLKTRAMSGKNTRLHINTGLSKHPSGCVVWMGWQRNEGTNRIELEYRWFGGAPGHPLPDLGTVVGKHTKGTRREPRRSGPTLASLTWASSTRSQMSAASSTGCSDHSMPGSLLADWLGARATFRRCRRICPEITLPSSYRQSLTKVSGTPKSQALIRGHVIPPRGDSPDGHELLLKSARAFIWEIVMSPRC